jgi:hypothetical protein
VLLQQRNKALQLLCSSANCTQDKHLLQMPKRRAGVALPGGAGHDD